jgi:hypothetical protein
MLAFSFGEMRQVEVPDSVLNGNLENTLECVFHYGQNDHQNQPYPSVTAGDVVHINNETYMIAGVGFKKITENQLNQYRSLDRVDRFIGRCQFEIGKEIVGRQKK